MASGTDDVEEGIVGRKGTLGAFDKEDSGFCY